LKALRWRHQVLGSLKIVYAFYPDPAQQPVAATGAREPLLNGGIASRRDGVAAVR